MKTLALVPLQHTVPAVQVAGKMPVDVKKTPVDTLAMSGHKFAGYAAEIPLVWDGEEFALLETCDD